MQTGSILHPNTTPLARICNPCAPSLHPLKTFRIFKKGQQTLVRSYTIAINKVRTIFIITLMALFFNSCKRGCKDEKACDYDRKAKLKGTCSYEPESVKTVTLSRSYSDLQSYHGLDLITGSVISSTVAVNGLLYQLEDPNLGWGSMLYLEGGDGLTDFGNVKGLCEVKDKTITSAYSSASLENGYVIRLNSTGQYGRVYIAETHTATNKVVIKYEYPF